MIKTQLDQEGGLFFHLHVLMSFFVCQSVSQTLLFFKGKKKRTTEENPVLSSYIVLNVLEFQLWKF